MRVCTNGCFDGYGLHPGHLHLLETARDMGHSLTVFVNSDASVRRLKGPSRPLMPEELRVAALSACRWVNEVCVFDSENELERLIAGGCFAILAKGSEWEGKRITGAGYVERVEFIERLAGWSTTEIIERANGNG